MFTGRVNLVKRNKLIHVGFTMNGCMVSGCNTTWDIRDKVAEGNSSEVTCKRCKKLLEKADENGHAILSPRK
ncbi:hypothetical protein [Clostridium akagii]|uniref:hypothetical protein n=1 Tax=Clostridium akagii TaxID=91623 RepID=UPI00047AE29B|nr:hypothetical protein [Clostridium akagii]